MLCGMVNLGQCFGAGDCDWRNSYCWQFDDFSYLYVSLCFCFGSDSEYEFAGDLTISIPYFAPDKMALYACIGCCYFTLFFSFLIACAFCSTVSTEIRIIYSHPSCNLPNWPIIIVHYNIICSGNQSKEMHSFNEHFLWVWTKFGHKLNLVSQQIIYVLYFFLSTF